YKLDEDQAGSSMICPACRRELLVPKLPPPLPAAVHSQREGIYWQEIGDLHPDPSSAAEQECQRSRQPAERARREAARRPSRVRLWGVAALLTGVAMVPPTMAVIEALQLPPCLRRGYLPVVLPGFRRLS